MNASTPATTLQDRAVLRLSGEDVRDFLQGLVTQDMALVQEGAPQWAALLNAQGKAIADFILWAEGEDILVDCEAIGAETLVKKLKLYRLRRKIEIAMEQELAVHWSSTTPSFVLSLSKGEATGDGGSSPNVLRQAQDERKLVAIDPRLSALGNRWLATAADGDASADFRAHRLSLGVTEGVRELGEERTLWLECNAEELNGVSFTKGCYVGQENTARMHYRNKVNRRLVAVPIDQADEKRQRTAYPDLGLSIEHRRVEDIDAAQAPDWLTAALQK